MQLGAYLERWPDEAATPFPSSVTSVALAWKGITEHVSGEERSGRSLVELLDARGVILEGVELNPLTCLNGASFERRMEEAQGQMRIVQGLGAASVIISSAPEGSVGFDMTVAALTRLVAQAERMGLKLCLRNVCGSSVEQLEVLHVLLGRAAVPGFGLCLDNVEFQRAAVNPADAVLSFSDRIAMVRLGDELRSSPCAPGRGNAHVGATIEALAAERFEGPLLVDKEWLHAVVDRFGEYLD